VRVGIVGDLHARFVHPMYRRFIMDKFQQWRVDQIIFIGDIVDLHALSFWEHDPDGRSAGDETAEAWDEVQLWRRTFRKARVCIGNHDERQFRVARKAGLPTRYLKNYAEIWGTPGWDWKFKFEIDGAFYTHGTGLSGKDAAFNLALEIRCPAVIGHIHSNLGAKYHANEFDRVFGLSVGCGIDTRAYSFAYGRHAPKRPLLGCGIVIDGEQAIAEPMFCGRLEKYNRKRAGRRAK